MRLIKRSPWPLSRRCVISWTTMYSRQRGGFFASSGLSQTVPELAMQVPHWSSCGGWPPCRLQPRRSAATCLSRQEARPGVGGDTTDPKPPFVQPDRCPRVSLPTTCCLWFPRRSARCGARRRGGSAHPRRSESPRHHLPLCLAVRGLQLLTLALDPRKALHDSKADFFSCLR